MNNYEQKYKEALEKAKRLHSEPTGGTERIVCEQIFPVLKESEDDRILKHLKAVVKAYDMWAERGLDMNDILAWLEKKGEQRFADGTFVNVDDVREDFVNEVYRVLDADSTNDRANQIIDAFDNLPTVTIKQDPCDNCKDVMLNCHNFPCIKKIAFKQGKSVFEAINEEKVDNANKVEPKDYSSIDPHFGKPIDKFEPKFKAGDWIVRELDNSVHQVKAVIENISNGKYGYDLTKGGYISSQDANFYHLWTIQDAKDGDVLYSPKGAGVECIFLIKGWKQVECSGKTLCSSICYRVKEDEIVVCGLGAIWWDGVVDPYYPATKEQRDTLMKAMANAGYTFDFEKKELKKIEDEIEIPYGAKDSELQEDTYYIPKGFHAEIDDDKVVIKKGEKPNAWSEEDEEILNLIIARLQSHADVDFEEYSKEYDWLNSPKVRSAWKPSDAQMIVLNEIITNGHLLGANEKILKGLQEQLKKL